MFYCLLGQDKEKQGETKNGGSWCKLHVKKTVVHIAVFWFLVVSSSLCFFCDASAAHNFSQW